MTNHPKKLIFYYRVLYFYLLNLLEYDAIEILSSFYKKKKTVNMLNSVEILILLTILKHF
jgi:hypothetical protein